MLCFLAKTTRGLILTNICGGEIKVIIIDVTDLLFYIIAIRKKIQFQNFYFFGFKEKLSR